MCLKCIIFSNKFSKIAKPPQRTVIFNFSKLKYFFGYVIWPNYAYDLFQTDYDEIELQKINYDFILVTSPLRYSKTSPKYVTKFFYFAPPPLSQSKLLATPVCINVPGLKSARAKQLLKKRNIIRVYSSCAFFSFFNWHKKPWEKNHAWTILLLRCYLNVVRKVKFTHYKLFSTGLSKYYVTVCAVLIN